MVEGDLLSTAGDEQPAMATAVVATATGEQQQLVLATAVSVAVSTIAVFNDGWRCEIKVH